MVKFHDQASFCFQPSFIFAQYMLHAVPPLACCRYSVSCELGSSTKNSQRNMRGGVCGEKPLSTQTPYHFLHSRLSALIRMPKKATSSQLFFSSLLLWEFVRDKVYKFAFRKRGSVVKLASLRYKTCIRAVHMGEKRGRGRWGGARRWCCG